MMDLLSLIAQADIADCRRVGRRVIVNGCERQLTEEAAYWRGLAAIGEREGLPIEKLLDDIQRRRKARHFAEAVRIFVITYFRALAATDVQVDVRHGGGA